jgi:hypothetical protein
MSEYALKSMVKPCPDLKNYVLKSEIPPCPDLKNYVLKSEIPPCPEQTDLTKYVLKSQIPACPTPVICPDCPVCPPAYKYIQDDPRFKNWLIRFEDEVEEKINKLYIRKNDCNKKIDESFKKGVEEGKNDAYKSIARESGPEFLKKCLHPGSGNNKKPSSGQNIGYLNDMQNNRDQNRDQNRNQNRNHKEALDRERNRLKDIEKKLEYEKNTSREEKLSKNKSQKINTTSGNEEFVLGWDPTSLGFGSINYQMKKPIIK